MDKVENLKPEEILKMKEENIKYKDEKVCTICKTYPRNRLYLPCGHLATCSICSPALRNCSICKKIIRGVVCVYF